MMGGCGYGDPDELLESGITRRGGDWGLFGRGDRDRSLGRGVVPQLGESNLMFSKLWATSNRGDGER
jgi:hypothetical protein